MDVTVAYEESYIELKLLSAGNLLKKVGKVASLLFYDIGKVQVQVQSPGWTMSAMRVCHGHLSPSDLCIIRPRKFFLFAKSIHCNVL